MEGMGAHQARQTLSRGELTIRHSPRSTENPADLHVVQSAMSVGLCVLFAFRGALSSSSRSSWAGKGRGAFLLHLRRAGEG